MDDRVTYLLLVCIMGSVTSLPMAPSLQISFPEKNDLDTNTLTLIKETANSNPDDDVIIEDDIRIKPGRSAINCPSCLWPKAADGTVPVPYVLSSDYKDYINLFTTTLQEFETLTCVRFIPRTTENDFLNIVSGQGCSSYVGRIGGSQTVAIDINGCMNRGHIQHELDHALGFYHEHMRSDRDNYVTINFQYISPGYAGNFAKATTNNLGLEYDYGSVMHYDNYAFSNTSNQPTIVPKPDPTVPIGQRNGLSILDVSKINKLYQCDVCAFLFNNDKGTVTSANYPSAYPNNANCVWLIRTPSGQVTLNIKALDIQSSPGCQLDYIKIYDGPSKNSPVLLDKTCGTGLFPLLVASTNQMLVEFVSDSSVTGVGFKADYNWVQCGGNFFTSPKTFTSAGYPLAYYPNLDCTFNITAPVGKRIALTFSDFQLESAYFCMYDYLQIHDASINYGPFCGSFKIPPITSTGNTLALTFHSDRSTQMRGFQASYTFI